MTDVLSMNYEKIEGVYSRTSDAEDSLRETEAAASSSTLSGDGAVIFITDSVEAGGDAPGGAEADDLTGASTEAEFVGMDSFIYTVIDDGASVSGMIWSIETDDFAGLSDDGETVSYDSDGDISLATAEFGDSDWFLA